MVKKDYVVPIILVGYGLFIMALSYELGLGGFRNPGPGLMPFIVALLLILNSSYLIASIFFRKDKIHENMEPEKKKQHLMRVSLVGLSLFVYALLLEELGFLITTSILLIGLFLGVGYRWKFAVITSVIVIMITYFFFTYLGIRFPAGILESLRFGV